MILHGDILEMLATVADGSVQAVCTSPPYFALRKYEGVEPTLWPAVSYCPMPGLPAVEVPAVACCYGLEADPVAYVAHTVHICRELRRVLRDTGLIFWNLGDSYASGKGTCHNPGGGDSSFGMEKKDAGVVPLDRGNVSDLRAGGLKPKDMLGIPWRVAFALQADGW